MIYKVAIGLFTVFPPFCSVGKVAHNKRVCMEIRRQMSLTLLRLGGGGGLLMSAPNLISSQFQTILDNPSISYNFASNLSGNLVMW